MTREKAIKELKNIKENIFWGDEYGACFRDEWVEAYEMAIAALREQPQWISVEERLPEEWRVKGGDLVNYLVYMPEYGVDVGNYAKPVKTWLCMGIPCKVTHWMPLPEPPKEEV